RGGPLSRRLRRLCYLHRRSDSYRMERPVLRAGIAPAGDPRLGTAHCYSRPVIVCWLNPLSPSLGFNLRRKSLEIVERAVERWPPPNQPLPSTGSANSILKGVKLSQSRPTAEFER